VKGGIGFRVLSRTFTILLDRVQFERSRQTPIGLDIIYQGSRAQGSWCRHRDLGFFVKLRVWGVGCRV
jgi:hypothetical protein